MVSVNALSHAITGLGPLDFLGLGNLNDAGYLKGSSKNSAYNLTLKEIVQGSSIGSSVTVGTAVKENLMSNGIGSLGMIAGFKVAEKMFKGIGINRQMNKLVRSAGLGKVVKF